MNTVGAALLSDVQKEVLDEVLVGVPYNSASQFHEYFGTKAAPPRLGMSCAWQSFTAGRMVRERSGITADYLIDGRHVAAVYRSDDGLVILDPYLLHGEPLRLDRGAAVDGTVRTTVDAYPFRVKADGTPAPSRVRPPGTSTTTPSASTTCGTARGAATTRRPGRSCCAPTPGSRRCRRRPTSYDACWSTRSSTASPSASCTPSAARWRS
ncbi:hypothetical protein DN402_23730 [Streptomyces sp. SW4]|nr:hypothetical protein DN402_23730 [Streptomyces sp. SW4]